MIHTFSGCYYSDLKVTPKDWKSARASIKKDWMIYYRFYDPMHRDTKPKGLLVVIKRMNSFNNLKDRQQATELLMKQENDILALQGFNPITGVFMAPSAAMAGMDAGIGLVKALRAAYKNLQTTNRTVLNDINSVINGFELAAGSLVDQSRMLRYCDLPIGEIRVKHIREILKQCYVVNDRFTDKRYNRYKDYLSMLFKELLEMDLIESNPVRELAKKPVQRKMQEVLTEKEERAVNTLLIHRNYTFWRFVQIFFYSDARETELMKLRKDAGVRLDAQEFTVCILKGKNRREDIKQISNEVLGLWQELWDEAKPGQYLFSKNLRPGDHPIRVDQLGRRWAKYVKQEMGINKNMRSLNHLHLTKVSEMLGIETAAGSRGHTTPIITMTRYDVGHKKRVLKAVRESGVKFGGK